MSTISSNGAIPASVLAAINGTNASSGTANANGTSGTAGSNTQPTTAAGMQSQFLTLLVTQLQNQDPLNPMDNAQITTQLAQISTVDGISQLNSTVQSLLSSNADSQTLQAASLMGRNVLVDGSNVNLSQGAASAGLDLSGNVDAVAVTIKDPAGNTVKTLNLGAMKAGIQPFTWDGSTDKGGTAADGQYTMSVTASQAGKSVDATTLSSAAVASVARGSSGVSINLGNQGNVALSDIKQIL